MFAAWTSVDPRRDGHIAVAASAMRLLGAELTRVEPEFVEIRLPFRDELTQQNGFFHAGMSSTIADSAGGYAGYTLFPAESPARAK